MTNNVTDIELRMECLRLAVEFGTQRDILQPSKLADEYYKWVTQGSGKRPADSRKDDVAKQPRNARNVRQSGSVPQSQM